MTHFRLPMPGRPEECGQGNEVNHSEEVLFDTTRPTPSELSLSWITPLLGSILENLGCWNQGVAGS